MRRRQRGVRAGFTMLELLISLMVTLVILALAAPLYRAQTTAVNSTAGRTDAARTAMFALDAIDQDMRNAGVGVFDGQPLFIRASTGAVSFNGDLVTTRVNDPVAVFRDPDADSVAVDALTPALAVTLPNSSNVYPQPTGTYNSNAETISFFMAQDTVRHPVTNAYLYALRRKVNRQPEEIIARNLIWDGTTPVFRYFRRFANGSLGELNPAALPLFHSVVRHGAQNDTGPSALIDSIAVVRVRMIAIFKDPRGKHVTDTLWRDIKVANQGLLVRAQCGEIPLTPGAPSTDVSTVAFRRVVTLTWNASTDENAGERDVEMYAVYRRVNGTIDWGEPIANVPASGLATTSYVDDTPVVGTTYDYAISALDCTPAPSTLSAFATRLVTP
jgi:prepilin-type N-terminal cleavage/methylation domain-containing protein